MKKVPFILLVFVISTATLLAQRTISGKVVDEQDLPLIGATILVQGTSSGTATDVDGNFELSVETTDSLVFSYTGYASKVIGVGAQSRLNVTMQPEAELLDKVVVIGYGSVKKSDLTGAVGTFDPDEEEAQQFNDFQSLLQGRVAGVYVQSNGGELGSPSSIRIRGANSLRGDNEPLYVVDGIIVNSTSEDTADPLSGGSSYLSPQNGLTGINPQDIESIEILKDASATAIYGSRGANGVIIITTKGGQSGEAKIEYSGIGRVGEATNLVDVLKTNDFVNYQDDARALLDFSPRFYTYGDGSIALFQESPEFMEENASDIERLEAVDWYEDIFRTAVSQNHRLRVSGGSERDRYYLAGGFQENEGVIPNASVTVSDILFNFNRDLNDRLNVSTRLSAQLTNNKASRGTENIGGFNTSLTRQITLGTPLLGFAGNNLDNDDVDRIVDGPRAWIEDYDDDSREVRTLGALKLDYKISEVFTYRFQAGGDYRSKTRQLWYGTSIFRGNQANGEAGISTLNRFRYNIDNTLMFKTKLGRRSRLNGTVGAVYDATNLELTSFSASDFANKDLRYDGISQGQVFSPLAYETRDEALISFLGRVNYSYRNRYLATASFRSDGTSKFADGNKYSFFPAVSLAWKITSEPFMAAQNLFSEAKLRVGYGLTGSQAIRPYQTLARFGPTGNLLSDGQGGGITAFVPLNLANENLIWETTSQFNAGLDFGLLNDRFIGTLDVYHKRTYDLLQELNVGPSSGFSSFTANQGDLINRGVELSLNAHVLTGKLKWTVRGNIGFNRNEITDLGLEPTQFGTETYSAFLGRNVSGGSFFKAPANIFIEGQPVGLFYGYETNGIVSNTADLEVAPNVQGIETQLGDVFYVDQDGDGNITDADLTIIGDPNPDFTYGFGSELSYGPLRLSFQFNGVSGNEIANGNRGRNAFADGSTNNVRSEAYFDAWSAENPDGTFPRLNYNNLGDFTDRFVEDGSFLRLSYVSLSYSLPTGTVRGIEKANFFISGQNLLLITNYEGFDPEVDSFSFDPSRRGVDFGSFPRQRSISFGLTLGI